MKAYLKDRRSMKKCRGYELVQLVCFLLATLLAAEVSSADETEMPRWWADSNDASKLEYALAKKDTTLVEQLLQSGVNPIKVEERFNTSIFLLQFRDKIFDERNLEITTLLLSHNADVNYGIRPDECPPLFYIVGIGEPSTEKTRAVNLMLDFNANIDVEDRCPSSLLHRALIADEFEISRSLLERGYRPGKRELDDLAWVRDPDTLKYLLDAINPDLLIRNIELFYSSDIPLFFQYLIDNNNLPDRIEVDGHDCFTPASYAANKRKPRILLALKKHGLDLSEDDCQGKDSYDYWPELDKYLTKLNQGG